MPGSVGEGVFHAVCEKPGKKVSAVKKAEADAATAEEVYKAKISNPYLVHWEANDTAAWNEALRQDEILRTSSKWANKPYAERFEEVVRPVRAIMPDASVLENIRSAVHVKQVTKQ
ncbi:hypothetical protein [Nitrosovibrio tenuis]|uniref:Uncharacterized protein n=1 Tax=Nitrosovibrio tenuis TaxID=1233 RepID=A0A1H7Q451_9PROT|nr:hypothetical protein [Nitrosovibrio tenuis]SEL42077.1 hypothetical protein SAMN05216387_11095 [Nitrosovibrio tenuis]